MAILKGAKLTMEADVDDDGSDETGVFDLSTGIQISPGVRTGELIGGTGSTIGALVNDITNSGGNGRAGFNLDAGGGAATYTIEFVGFEGNVDQWGDGTSNAQADASGEDVWRQLSVFQRYLDVGTYDSRNAATLEWGEFSSGGVYSPIAVTPEEPQLTFDAYEQSSTFDGSITFVSTRALNQAAISAAQDES